ncbi:MAG: hypothetical protein KBB26_03835 [Candidatus Omnitrophica bacterium]|nr:hypothetical protein [Candidatus Omnitrophota bacterium]HPB67310.1 hypothetical protein [Candidatus Omnitrophota bacterium]
MKLPSGLKIMVRPDSPARRALSRALPVLIVLAGWLLLWPLHDYQNYIAQGDHGRDFYCYASILKGAVPFRDYWWVYGPIMPYYYAAFFKMLGLTMASVLTGEIVLKIIAGFMIYRSVHLLCGKAWGCLAALWFWSFYPYFFFTYNHSGGIALLTAITFFLLRYIKTGSPKSLYQGLGCIVLLSFVKLNMGICSLFSFTVSVLFIDLIQRRTIRGRGNFFLAALVIVPAGIGLVYYLFFKGLPFYIVRQSFPFLGSDRQFSLPLALAAKVYRAHLVHAITLTTFSKLYYSLLGIMAVSVLFRALKGRKNAPVSRITFLSMAVLLFLSLAHLHEYLLSGNQYQLFWASPFHIIFMFILLSTQARLSSPPMRIILYSFFIIFMGLTLARRDAWGTKQPALYWAHPRARIYLNNSPQWINTVEQTTAYLDAHLAPGEPFFVFPYDPLYYYMTGRPAASRQLMFFYNNHIPLEQEVATIQDLQKKKIRYVVLSSRVQTRESRLGYFGVTHCRLLARYFIDNYEQVADFGEWHRPAQWVENHGTIIIRRKHNQ